MNQNLQETYGGIDFWPVPQIKLMKLEEHQTIDWHLRVSALHFIPGKSISLHCLVTLYMLTTYHTPTYSEL